MSDRNPNIECLARKVGERWEYRSLIFWAEAGGVHIIDMDPRPDDPETDKYVSLPKWSERVKMQRAYVEHAERDSHIGTPIQIEKKHYHLNAIKSCLRAMEDVERTAQRQGDCTDPIVQEYYKKHVAPVKQTYQVPSLILP